MNPKPWSRPGGQLAAVGVQRELAVSGDAMPPSMKGPLSPLAAEAEGLEPGHVRKLKPS
jgi:hypothetical protein